MTVWPRCFGWLRGGAELFVCVIAQCNRGSGSSKLVATAAALQTPKARPSSSAKTQSQAAARLLPSCCQAAAKLLPSCCQAAAKLLPSWASSCFHPALQLGAGRLQKALKLAWVLGCP
jgi:hypothetical protein